MHRHPAFTLAELLIALAILGVIAVFTIPKVLQSQQDSRFRAIAKETAASVSSAYQSYLMDNGSALNMRPGYLTPYLNYVRIDTTTVIDNEWGASSRTCGGAGIPCIVLHNGAILFLDNGTIFTGTASTNAIQMLLDPDGTYSGSTTGNGKGVWMTLYYNGRVSTHGTIDPATTYSYGVPGPCPGCDPPWFGWN